MKVVAINEKTREIEFKDVPNGFIQCHVIGDYYPRKESTRDHKAGINKFISLKAEEMPDEQRTALSLETTLLRRSQKYSNLYKRAEWLNELNESGMTVKELKAQLEKLNDDDIVVIQAEKGCSWDERGYDFGWFDFEPIDDTELKNVYVIGKA